MADINRTPSPSLRGQFWPPEPETQDPQASIAPLQVPQGMTELQGLAGHTYGELPGEFEPLYGGGHPMQSTTAPPANVHFLELLPSHMAIFFDSGEAQLPPSAATEAEWMEMDRDWRAEGFGGLPGFSQAAQMGLGMDGRTQCVAPDQLMARFDGADVFAPAPPSPQGGEKRPASPFGQPSPKRLELIDPRLRGLQVVPSASPAAGQDKLVVASCKKDKEDPLHCLKTKGKKCKKEMEYFGFQGTEGAEKVLQACEKVLGLDLGDGIHAHVGVQLNDQAATVYRRLDSNNHPADLRILIPGSKEKNGYSNSEETILADMRAGKKLAEQNALSRALNKGKAGPNYPFAGDMAHYWKVHKDEFKKIGFGEPDVPGQLKEVLRACDRVPRAKWVDLGDDFHLVTIKTPKEDTTCVVLGLKEVEKKKKGGDSEMRTLTHQIRVMPPHMTPQAFKEKLKKQAAANVKVGIGRVQTVQAEYSVMGWTPSIVEKVLARRSKVLRELFGEEGNTRTFVRDLSRQCDRVQNDGAKCEVVADDGGFLIQHFKLESGEGEEKQERHVLRLEVNGVVRDLLPFDPKKLEEAIDDVKKVQKNVKNRFKGFAPRKERGAQAAADAGPAAG